MIKNHLKKIILPITLTQIIGCSYAEKAPSLVPQSQRISNVVLTENKLGKVVDYNTRYRSDGSKNVYRIFAETDDKQVYEIFIEEGARLNGSIKTGSYVLFPTKRIESYDGRARKLDAFEKHCCPNSKEGCTTTKHSCKGSSYIGNMKAEDLSVSE